MSLQIIKCPKCKHEFPTRKEGKFQCGKCGHKFKKIKVELMTKKEVFQKRKTKDRNCLT